MVRLRTLVGATLAATAALVAVALGNPHAAAQAPAEPAVDVVDVKGLVDPSLAGFVEDAMRSAERTGATVLLQIDSLGGYGDEAERVGRVIRGARVPVVAWVGPAGARAEGSSLFIVYSASVAAMAPGAGLGPGRPFDLGTSPSREDPREVARLTSELESLAPGAGATEAGVRAVVTGPALPAGPALAKGAVALVAADIGDLLVKLDGRPVMTAAGRSVLATKGTAARPVAVRFHGIGPVRRVLHAVGTPTAVYVLIVLGLWGIAFEATQPGLGLAGIAGVIFLAFAGYGLTVVPVHWSGLAILLAGTGLMALDVLIRRVAVLTVVGAAAFATGSFLAWRGVSSSIDLPVWLMVLATIGSLLFFGFGMTVALRSRERVRTAQVGLVGLVGEVRSDLDPEGGVYVKGTIWRARSSDGPIPKGSRVRVRGIDGLILRVEPESGETGG
ncbi:MAG: nodulation protein NfeD [Actinobacteria bacterium]|nr:MAG: nodulation protein NfeD [Actinomycetota bacterium]